MQGAAHPDPTRDLQEALIVRAVAGRQVVVATKRASACGSCAIKEGCGPALLASMAKEDELVLDLPDGLSVAAGDRVLVTLPGTELLSAAWLGYLLPLLVLVVGVSFLSALGLPDLSVALLSIPLLALSFWPLVKAERREPSGPALRVVGVLPASGS